MTLPASNCMHCHRLGYVSEDQTTLFSPKSKRITSLVRFSCSGCTHQWIAPLEEAELHGRFLDRAGLR